MGYLSYNQGTVGGRMGNVTSFLTYDGLKHGRPAGGASVTIEAGFPVHNTVGTTAGVTSSEFSTAGSSLLVAVVTSIASTNTMSAITSMAGGGLTWEKNAGRGEMWDTDTEIWSAYSAGALTNKAVTASWALNNVTQPCITVYSLIGAKTSSVGGTVKNYTVDSTSANPSLSVQAETQGSIVLAGAYNPSSYNETSTAVAGTTIFQGYNPPGNAVALASSTPTSAAGATVSLGSTGWTGNGVYFCASEFVPNGTPDQAYIDGGSYCAWTNWGNGTSPRDTNAFSAPSGKLIVVITFGARNTGAVSSIASVVVDPAGVNLSLTKHATEYDDTYATLSLWYGYAPSNLTNVITRVTSTATGVVFAAYVLKMSNVPASSPIGVSNQEGTPTDVRNTQLTGCTARSLLLSIGIDGIGGVSGIAPYAGCVDVFSQQTYLAGMIASRRITSAGNFRVGSADVVDGNYLKMAAWEILKG